MEESIVVLANSVKFRGHCVAGKSLNTGQWIRPVSSADGGKLDDAQCLVENKYGRWPVKTLQKVRVGFCAHTPLLNQPENYLINDAVWQQNYCFDAADLPSLLDKPESLWGEGRSVSIEAIESGAISIGQSLYLVKVEDLLMGYNDYGKPRAEFRYNGIYYDLPITDPEFDALFEQQVEGQDILCISLGVPLEGQCYKLVAAVY